ncbi:MAG: hypothetical protein HY763_12055 [Planctomycetes bacterium]|nr:hypothetical protein [Planctomycetota bacterium]
MPEAPRTGLCRSSDERRDEFYVGYLPVPPGHLFYLRLLMPLLLWLAVGVAAVVSGSHSDPGAGVWDTGRPQVLEGLLDVAPYPLLRVPSAKLGEPFTTYLLVETGKFGAGRRAAPHDGRLVRVSGWLIQRDGRRMIELEPGDGAIEPLESASASDLDRLRRPAAEPRGRVRLRGEIVDSKCYLGVMKPGEGKTHKECATLCISAGIPPMLVTRDASGTRSYFLLVRPDGDAQDARILPLVADPVEVSGTLDRVGDLNILRADPADIQRL